MDATVVIRALDHFLAALGMSHRSPKSYPLFHFKTPPAIPKRAGEFCDARRCRISGTELSRIFGADKKNVGLIVFFF